MTESKQHTQVPGRQVRVCGVWRPRGLQLRRHQQVPVDGAFVVCDLQLVICDLLMWLLQPLGSLLRTAPTTVEVPVDGALVVCGV